MSDESIVISVRGDVSGGRVIKRTLDDIAQSGDRANKTTALIEKQFRGLTSAANTLQAALGSVVVAIAFKGSIDASIRLQQLENRMLAATKSSQDAARAMGFVRAEAERLGLVFTTAADGFAGFSASALRSGLSFSQTKQIFSDIATAATSLQLPVERVQLVFKALEQIAGKGTVQMEELKGQLGDSLPGAVEIAAKAMGKTTAEFLKMVEAGEVLAVDFLPKFSAAIKDELGGAAVEGADSLLAATNRLKNAFFDLQTEFAKSGIADAYKDSVNGIADVFKDPAFLQAINDIGAGMAQIARQMAQNIGLFNEFFGITEKAGLAKMNGRIADLQGSPGGIFDNPIDRSLRSAELKQLEARRDQTVKVMEAEKQLAGFKSGWEADMEKVRTFNRDKADAEVRKEMDSQRKLAEQKTKGTAAAKKGQTEITQAIKASLTQEEKLTAEISNLERLKGFAKTKSEIDAINRGIENTNKELEEVRLKAEMDGPIAKAFGRLADTVDDSLRDAFTTAATETEGTWEKVFEGLKSSFKKMLAEMAYEALARPIVVSILGQAGSSMGLSGGAVSSVLGTGGGLNFSSLGSTAKGLLNGGLYSPTLGGIGSGIGNVLSGQAWGAMGPSRAAAIGGGAFGNLGYGAIGGLGASLLGLGSQNSIVNMATGTLGSLAGGAIGTSIGSILGMAGGPIGALAGGFLGTAVGGLFGSSKPKRGTLGGVIRASDGRLNFASNGREGSDDFVRAVIDPLNAIMEQLGGGFKDQGLGSLETNTVRDKKTVLFHDQIVSKKAGDVDAVIRAVLNRNDLFTGANSQLLDVVRRSTQLGSGGGQILSDIGLAKQAFGITDPNPEIQAAKDALEAIDEQFKTLTERAIQLGLPMDKLTIAFAEQKSAMEGAIKAMQAGFSSLEEMTASFKAFLDGQALGANSSLNPMGKLALAQENYGSLLDKAQGGDLSVTKELLAAAGVVIDVGRSIFASSKGFADLEALIRTDVQEIARAAGVPGYANGTNYAAQGLAWVGERGPELVNFRGGEQVHTASQSADMVKGQALQNMRIEGLLSELLEEMHKTQTNTGKLVKAKTLDTARQRVTA